MFDPIEAKESWSKLLGGRTLPRCEHEEVCIRLVTKKPGVNCGEPPLLIHLFVEYSSPSPSTPPVLSVATRVNPFRELS